MTINKAVSALEKHFPRGRAEKYDNVGLLCGNPSREITGILLTHDTTEAVVTEALEKDCNFILSFHPVWFSSLKSLTGKNYVERTILKALENKIAIYAVHTVWDNAADGVNFGIAEKLGLKNQQILLPVKNQLKRLDVYVPTNFVQQVKTALFEAGAGGIGNYDECSFTVAGQGTFRPLAGSEPFSGQTCVREYAEEEMITVILEGFREKQVITAMRAAHPYEEVAYNLIPLDNENHHSGLGRIGDLPEPLAAEDFLRMVKKVFDLKVIRHSEAPRKKISRVGLLGGSGATAIGAARSQKCDAYLTGDIKYHEFFQGEGEMLICDIGHFESEQFVVDQLYKVVSEIFPKFAVSKSVVKTNPVNYFV